MSSSGMVSLSLIQFLTSYDQGRISNTLPVTQPTFKSAVRNSIFLPDTSPHAAQFQLFHTKPNEKKMLTPTKAPMIAKTMRIIKMFLEGSISRSRRPLAVPKTPILRWLGVCDDYWEPTFLFLSSLQ